MMKKMIATALLSTAAISSSQAAVFNGFSANLAGGVQFQDNSKHTSSLTKGYTKTQKKSFNKIFGGDKTAGLFGFGFKYEMSKSNSLYTSIGLDFAFPTSHVSKNTKIQESVFGNAIKTKFTNKIGFSTELNGALGYNFCNNFVVYGLAGLRLAKHEVKLNTKVPGEKTSSQDHATKLVPVVGFGLDAAIPGTKMSAGLMFKHSFATKVQVKNKKFIGSSKHGTIKSSGNEILARVSYHF